MSLPSGARVLRSGNGSRAPLLFLHGVGGGAWSWEPQRAAFAAERPVFVWEARGHGGAARVADAGLADYAADAREALAAVTVSAGQPPVVVGHSMGGLLALVLAAEHTVAGVAVVDPVYPDGGPASGHSLGPLGPLAPVLLRPLVASFLRDGRLARAISRQMFVHSFSDRARMEDAWREQRRQVPIEYPKMFFEAFGTPEGFPVRPYADDITVPALAINVRSKALLETLRRQLRERLTEVQLRGGHYLQLDRPDDIIERLRRFCSERIDT